MQRFNCFVRYSVLIGSDMAGSIDLSNRQILRWLDVDQLVMAIQAF